mgnify:CR=1 FL=1|tara:strand:+ start:5357 stop:6175 length:819 start_codon:yes stop_codon:yes gene_type:complete
MGIRMSKVRYIKFNPDEFLVGTIGLSASEVGVYIHVISLMYSTNSSIQICDERIYRTFTTKANIIKKSIESLIQKKKLDFDGEHLSNKRVLSELQRISDRRVSGTQLASVGNVKKPTIKQKQPLKKNLKSYTIDNKHKSLNNKQELNDFDKIWNLWKKKTGKNIALESYKKCLNDYDFKTIINGVRFYMHENSNTEHKFILMLSTFLNQKRFADYENKIFGESENITESNVWELRVEKFKNGGQWLRNIYGNSPAETNNDIPIEILKKYGYV